MDMVYTSRPSRIGRTQVVWPENKRQYTVTPIHLCPLPSSPPVILCIPSLSALAVLIRGSKWKGGKPFSPPENCYVYSVCLHRRKGGGERGNRNPIEEIPPPSIGFSTKWERGKEEAECFVGQEEIKKAERKSGSNRSESFFFARSIERKVAVNGAKKLFTTPNEDIGGRSS